MTLLVVPVVVDDDDDEDDDDNDDAEESLVTNSAVCESRAKLKLGLHLTRKHMEPWTHSKRRTIQLTR